MAKRRSHSKIDGLPTELREAINDAIVNKRMTYREITALIQGAGHDISQKSVERYGKGFLAKLESISTAREQARAIVETTAEGKLDMAEATSTVAFDLLFQILLDAKDEEKEVSKFTLEAMRTFAGMERSAVSREKLRYQFDKGVAKASEEIKAQLKVELAKDEELQAKILAKIDAVEKSLVS